MTWMAAALRRAVEVEALEAKARAVGADVPGIRRLVAASGLSYAGALQEAVASAQRWPEPAEVDFIPRGTLAYDAARLGVVRRVLTHALAVDLETGARNLAVSLAAFGDRLRSR